jgi:hypothetical protein
MTFKENATAGGLGTDCGVGDTCCYLMATNAVGADPVGNCPLPCIHPPRTRLCIIIVTQLTLI